MALHWDLTKVDDAEQTCWISYVDDNEEKQERINPVTEALIWATISTGIGDITEKTVDEFFMRLRFKERIYGCYLTRNSFITFEEVQKHIGLHTNVAYETPAKWWAHQRKNWATELEREKRRA